MALDDRFLSVRDFRTKELTGTTSSSANTAAMFRHGANDKPAFWLALEGSVYIPRYGVGPVDMDVRSTRTSEPFRLLLFYG